MDKSFVIKSLRGIIEYILTLFTLKGYIKREILFKNLSTKKITLLPNLVYERLSHGFSSVVDPTEIKDSLAMGKGLFAAVTILLDKIIAFYPAHVTIIKGSDGEDRGTAADVLGFKNKMKQFQDDVNEGKQVFEEYMFTFPIFSILAFPDVYTPFQNAHLTNDPCFDIHWFLCSHSKGQKITDEYFINAYIHYAVSVLLRANSKFVIFENICLLLSTEIIPIGSEILVPYGAKYWFEKGIERGGPKHFIQDGVRKNNYEFFVDNYEVLKGKADALILKHPFIWEIYMKKIN
jgi:hypothetical protein